jgi:hypothetical protein
MLSLVRSVYRKRRQFRWMYHEERKNPYPLAWRKKLRAWRMGFLSGSYLFLDLDRHAPENYINDRMRFLRLSFLNGPYAEILHNKLLFGEVFRRHPDVVPETFALLRHKQVWPMSESEPVRTMDDVLDLLARRGRLVMKGTRGFGGGDCTILEHRDGAIAFSGRVVSRQQAIDRLGSRREQIVTEYVQQAAYSREIYSGSANSIRMLTMVDDETGEPFLARAVHRFGGGARMVDNVTQGGVAAIIGPDDDRLGIGVQIDDDGHPQYLERHPDTGAQITGVRVPHWDLVVDRILALAREHPYIPYIGWDVVVTDDGLRILEGNSNSGVLFTQFHGPLLADPRVRRFFERHRVL